MPEEAPTDVPDPGPAPVDGGADSDESRPGLLVIRVTAALVLLAGALLVLRPFLVPMVWAAIVAYITWPLYAQVRARTGHPRLTAAAFTFALLFGLGLPVAWFLVTLAEQGTQLVGVIQPWLRAGAPLPQWLSEIEWLGPRLEQLRETAVPADFTPYLTQYSRQLSNGLVRLAGGVASNLFAFSVTLLALYALYVDGEYLTVQARRLAAAFFPQTAPGFLDDVGGVVRAVVFGLIGTGIAQGVVAGIGLAIFGVPAPVALGALTALLSFIPVGPPLVWGSAAIWLFFNASTGAALGMAVWGIVLISSLDNVLRPILISRSGSIRIPFLVVFFGVLGGLATFGLLGLFAGPVLLSVSFALVAQFARSHGAREPGSEDASGEETADAGSAGA